MKRNVVVDEFLRIAALPRPSGREDAVREYLAVSAERMGCPWKRDEAGNLAVFVPATPGMETAPCVVLQAHMDMVCVADRPWDFLREPIRVVERDGWLSAEGTSLGADDGIGCAMALCAARDLAHGPLSLLFTVEEETGLRGMSALSPELIDDRAGYAINLDFESEGHVCVACAGGLVVEAEAALPTERLDAGTPSARLLRARGVLGGHSGLDIDGRPLNLHHYLFGLLGGLGARLVSYDGGGAVNAIPVGAEATIAFPGSDERRVESALALGAASFARDYAREGGAPTLEFGPLGGGLPDRCLSADWTARLARTVAALPDGVLSRHAGLGGGLKGSSSLGIVRLTADGTLRMGATARSDDEKEAAELRERVISTLSELPGAALRTAGFPPWRPDRDSPLVRYVQDRRVGLFPARPSLYPSTPASNAGLSPPSARASGPFRSGRTSSGSIRRRNVPSWPRSGGSTPGSRLSLARPRP